MADFVDIVSLNLGTTFGGWYAKNNDMITRLNALNVASIIGGDGITASPHTAANGGYTLSLSGTVTRDMTFNNVTVNGTLTSNFAGAVSGTTIVLPANTGVTVGNIVYLDSTGNLQKALADDECTAEVVGIVIGFTGGSAQVATTGKISGSSIISAFTGTPGATLQKGVVYFLSGGVSGAGTTLEPDVTSYVSKPMLLGLTGDSGLILPYRGFIATEGTVGNTTVVQGVCGGSGVLSINGITAALWNNTPYNIANLRQTGHLYALTFVNIPGYASRLTKSLTIDLGFAFNKITPLKSGGIEIYDSANLTSIVNSNSVTYNKHFISNPDGGFIFSTSGVTGDVYKITKIKIIPKSGQAPANFTFSLQKEYNSYAGTTASVSNSLDFTAAATALRIELRRNGYAIAGSFITPSLQELSYTSETVSSPLITADIHNLPYTPGATENFIYGLTSGTISGNPDSGGSFPAVQYQQGVATGVRHKTRTSTFTINNVTIGGPASDASKYMKASIQNQYYDLQTGSEGYTMESALLGWNAQYGAISESLYFVPVSVLYKILNDGVDAAEDIICNILLEMYKYDTNTKATTGSAIIISSKYTLTSHKHSYSGTMANSI
jgi:hypothetical protein